MINKKIKLLKSKRLDYENDIKIKFENINFLRLMIKAGNNALKKSELSKDYYLIFKIMEKHYSIGNLIDVLRVNKNCLDELTLNISNGKKRKISKNSIKNKGFFDRMFNLFN